MIGPVPAAALPLTGGTLTGALVAAKGTNLLPGLAIGESDSGLYMTGAGATTELGFTLNGAATPQLLLKQTGVSTFSGTCEATIFSASSRLQTSESGALALYCYGAAAGAQVGSGGYDVHTAGLCYIGKAISLGVKLGRTGYPVHLSAHNAAPTDADLVAGGITFFLDEATHKISARVRYADGTTYKTITTPIPIS